MIILWDNGQQYSDHGIYFTDTLDYDIEDCLMLLKSYQPEGHLIGQAHDIEWFEGGACPIDEFISYWTIRNKEVLYKIKPKTLRGFVKTWKKREEDLLTRATGTWHDRIKERYDREFVPLEQFVKELK